MTSLIHTLGCNVFHAMQTCFVSFPLQTILSIGLEEADEKHKHNHIKKKKEKKKNPTNMNISKYMATHAG